ncbi:MAG TPA: hypothetical protein VE959_17190 [Bryobacteraceae bacterium]|nr:hypothetical protein [Bryobacteraceae bacterium]
MTAHIRGVHRAGLGIPGLAAILLLGGCGYIGSPLPPLSNVPSRVADLDVAERGSRILVTFTVPEMTTEGQTIKAPLKLDLRIGPPGDDWAGRAKPVTAAIRNKIAHAEIPAAEWTGQQVTIGVRVTGANGKDSAWSYYQNLPIVPPPGKPLSLKSEATARGVHLTWEGPAGNFRIFRRAGDEKDFTMAGAADLLEWTDAKSEFGEHYWYRVQRIVKPDERHEAQSDPSDETAITPRDTFPPAAPTGLNAAAAPASVELSWDRNTEEDLAGYRIYRAVAGGEFEKVAEASQIPAWSDPNVEPGKTYRYAVTAVDRTGNESGRSAVAEATLQ